MPRKHKYLKDEQAKAFYEITNALEKAGYKSELAGTAAVLSSYEGKENIETRLIKITDKDTSEWPSEITLEGALSQLQDNYNIINLKDDENKQHRLYDRGDENSKLYELIKKELPENSQLDLFYQDLPLNFLIYEPAKKTD